MYPLDAFAMPAIRSDDLEDLPEAGKAMARDGGEDYGLVVLEGKHRELVQAYLASITFADALVGLR